ncbi:MAG: flavodoxin family protein [Desulfitobacteriaceae bacterium]
MTQSKMKTVLGLVSSQRKLANGEILVKEAVAALGSEYELKLIRLPDLKIEPCRGCYSCLIPEKRCPIDDDLYFLAEEMKKADGIILSAPCYALGPAAITKLLGDRIIALTQLLEEFWGKPCVIIGTAGIEGWEGYTLSALVNGARFLGLDVRDAYMFLGALPGEALEREGALARVQRLGLALWGPARQAEKGQCPTCWSEIWKFSEPGHVVCPFCGQKAQLVQAEDGVRWEYGERGKRFEKDHLKEHFHAWLQGKMQEYMLRRKDLAGIRNHYKMEEENWLKPDMARKTH